MLVFSAFLSLIFCLAVVIAIRRIATVLFGGSSIARIPGPPRSSWLKGHMDKLFSWKDGPQFHLDLIEKYDRVVKIYGFLGDEQLYVSDPAALQSILVKDQDNFEETEVFIENNKIIFGEGLVATVGEHHKRQRRLINPVFSVYRLRNLVPVFYDVAYRKALASAIDKDSDAESSEHEVLTKRNNSIVDMGQWLSRATLESIGQAGMGYSFDPLDSPSTNPYTRTVRALIPTMFRIAPLRLLTPFITRLGPPAFRRFLLNFVPIQAVQLLKQMSDHMDQTCKEILREKRATSNATHIGHGDGKAMALTDVIRDGKDVMSILLKANEVANEEERLSEAELLGQMNVLIFGAQDTTASALSRIMYLLSRPEHAALQTRLRDEALRAYTDNGGNNLEYDDLSDLPVLDAVLKETLRLYPPVPFVRRVSRQTSALSLSQPLILDDGRTAVNSITVPRGTTVWVSITGANRSREIWGDDAGEWKPERWLRGETELRSAEKKLPGLYSGMLTFLGGGRSCIGYRFALIEMKIILVTLLSSFRFTATEDQIVWNLSQILTPSFRAGGANDSGGEKQGMPISVEVLA
ncbi:cytochrome P450 [Phellopilus nigrolimitatus]|nr:cytochrome P450 [Phellopilus nigrolimitatus]